MTSFEIIQDVKFEFNNVLTWGVIPSRVGYTIPISISGDALTGLRNISESYHTKSPVYGRCNTVYLKAGALTPKQENELLNMGRLRIDVNIKVAAVNITDDGTRYLSLKVTRLRKVATVTEKVEEVVDCPED